MAFAEANKRSQVPPFHCREGGKESSRVWLRYLSSDRGARARRKGQRRGEQPSIVLFLFALFLVFDFQCRLKLFPATILWCTFLNHS